MNPYDEFLSGKSQILKAYRAAIRLKYALKADDEIARRLPEVEKAIDTALLAGEPVSVDVLTAFGEVL